MHTALHGLRPVRSRREQAAAAAAGGGEAEGGQGGDGGDGGGEVDGGEGRRAAFLSKRRSLDVTDECTASLSLFERALVTNCLRMGGNKKKLHVLL